MTFSQAIIAGLLASGLILSCAVSEGKTSPRTGKKVAIEYLNTDKQFKKTDKKKKRDVASVKKSKEKPKESKKQKKSAPLKKKKR